MSLPFDATLKDLGQDAPADTLATFDRPPTLPLQLLNVDLSTITASTDLVIGLGNPLKEIVCLDYQAGPDANKHADVLLYSALLYRLYRVPVHSIVVLLRRKATHKNLTGSVSYSARPGKGKMDFGYEVVRLWDKSADDLLAGALGVTPLAVLGALPRGVPVKKALRGVVERLIERLNREAPVERARKLLTSAYVLVGLRVQPSVARSLFKGVQAMHESSTYRAILDEGAEKLSKSIILRNGQKRFGPPSEAARAQLDAITEDLPRLLRMNDRLFDGAATDWDDLLGTP